MRQQKTVSPLAKAGLAFPGLGHLLTGDLVNGFGLLLLLGVVLWAFLGLFAGTDTWSDACFANGALDTAAAGCKTLTRAELGLLPPDREGGFRLHPWLALIGMVSALVVAWRTAWAHAFPKQRTHSEASSQWGEISKQFKRNRTGLIGLHSVSLMLLLAVVTPFIAPFDPDAIDAGGQLLAPSWAYLMGTDEFGRDLFSRILYGARISLSIGFIAVSISVTVGTSLGAIAGFFGGRIDAVVMWVVDMLLSLPRLVLLLAIVGFFRAGGAQSIYLIIVILGLTGWMGVSRIVRSQVLSLKEQDFVQACRALGLPNWRIILVHLIPNALAPVIVNASLAIGVTILVEASLSFLGLGVPPPTPTWGAIVNDGQEYIRSAPWIIVFPGLMIVVAVMSFSLLGDGLRDALDPKLRGRA